MFNGLTGASRVQRVAWWLVLGGLGAWGLRATILEGFVYEWPRHFVGDFQNVMFANFWWNGSGIYYGPIFVIERWLVDAAPGVFNIYFFVFLNVPLVIAAFVFAARAASLPWPLAVVAAVAWLCYSRLFISLAVAANPEILEMTLLCGAWYAATRARPSLSLTAVLVATLMKRVPGLFLPLVLLTETSRRALVTGALVSVGIMSLVGIGQGIGPLQGLIASLAPVPFDVGVFQKLPPQQRAEYSAATVYAQPFPYPSHFLGFGNALARLLRRPINDWTIHYIQDLYFLVAAAIIGYAIYVAFVLLRGRYRLPIFRATVLAFGIFFALMPIVAIATHPHTFVFLLPVWTAGIAIIAAERPNRQRALAALFGIGYVFTGFPVVVVPIYRLFGLNLALTTPFEDPIWANLLLIAGLFVYAHILIRDQRAAIEGSGVKHASNNATAKETASARRTGAL